MMTPNDLKNKTFTQAFRGYTRAEVDEFMTAVIENYTQLYSAYGQLRKNQDQLTKQLNDTEMALAAMKENENAIRCVLVNSQNAAARVVEAAEKRGEEIDALTRQKCGEVLALFRDKIRVERERLNALRAQVADFKERIYQQYQAHVETIESITATLSQDDWDMNPTDATRAVLMLLHGDLNRRTRNDEKEEERLDREIESVVDALTREKKENKSEAPDGE